MYCTPTTVQGQEKGGNHSHYDRKAEFRASRQWGWGKDNTVNVECALIRSNTAKQMSEKGRKKKQQ